MSGSIYLIGGGEIRKGETAEIDAEIIRIASNNSTLTFFATASGDNLDYITSIRSVFESDFTVLAPTEKDGQDAARSAIIDASVIYLGGGTTDLLIELFKRWDLLEHLQNALNRGTHVVGMSAGAQALAAWYIHENDNSIELRCGWGLVPVCVFVHAHPDSVLRAKKLWEDHPEAKKQTLVAIGEGGAWRTHQSETKSIGQVLLVQNP